MISRIVPSNNKGVIHEKHLHPSFDQHLSRFEVPKQQPSLRISDNLIHETKDFIELRGSPSLVGRGIANPMSERTRGFEMLLKGSTRFPLPALFSFVIFSNFVIFLFTSTK